MEPVKRVNNYDKKYLSILKEILENGSLETNRTGISAYTIPSSIVQHDMSEGFPLLTTRRIPYKSVRVELEGFLKGITSKNWYEERGCGFWNEWASPSFVSYGTDDDSKKRMRECDELGPIYGTSWRDFGQAYAYNRSNQKWLIDQGIDQLKNIVESLKSNPQSRQMVCVAWNPLNLGKMSLPPCHFAWRVQVIGGKLHLSWFQRSCDFVLGIPSNMSSYATLLHLLSLESGIPMGTITGHLDNVHVYENHVGGALKMIEDASWWDRLPTIETTDFSSIFDWDHSKTKLNDYNPIANLKFEVAV
jgi:thymidylate synthase